MKLLKVFIFLFLISLFATGCLTVERKEYKVQLKSETGGSATIKFINILSKYDDGRDVSLKDFAELITDYLQGESIMDDYPNAVNLKKRLFEENSVLCGEVTFDFDNFDVIKFYKYNEDSPYMLYNGGIASETYDSSNGFYGKDDMPVIFWDKSLKTFEWKTIVQDDLSETVSLLEQYKDWERKQ